MSGLDEERTSAARERLAALERTLVVVSIPGPRGATASVGHVRDASLPLRVHVAAGTHVVRIRKSDGTMVERSVDAKAGNVVELVLEVAKERPPASAPTAPAPQPKEPTSETSSAPTWGWVAIGGAGAFSLAAGYLGLKTLDSLDTYEASEYRDADAQDRTQRYKLWTNVAWGAAALSGTVGLVLVLSGGDSQERGSNAPAAGAQLRITPNGMTAGYRF